MDRHGRHSPVGHSGYHPGGMRVGGVSRNKSAVKVAMDRRYRDYSQEGPSPRPRWARPSSGCGTWSPHGPKDRVNVDKTIYQTMKNAGEIEIVFDRALTDRLKVILTIDNGGWSMDPYIAVVQTLFDYARSQFKDLKTYFFHNTHLRHRVGGSGALPEAPGASTSSRADPETRLIVVGDASMAPYELMATDGSIYIEERSGQPSIESAQVPGPDLSGTRSGSTRRPADGATPGPSAPSGRSFPCSSSLSTGSSRR